VTTADSQFIRKDRNDLSKPGAQQRVKSIFARLENNFIMGRSEVVDKSKFRPAWKKLKKEEKSEKRRDFNDVWIRWTAATRSAATWP